MNGRKNSESFCVFLENHTDVEPENNTHDLQHVAMDHTSEAPDAPETASVSHIDSGKNKLMSVYFESLDAYIILWNLNENLC